jgi:hypothetical protein
VKDHNQPATTIHRDESTATIGVISTEQAPKATNKAPRARRKLCLDEELDALEVQQNIGEVRTGGLEDTFIFGFTPKKRQIRTKTEESPVAEEPQQHKKNSVPKAKKTTKAKKQLEDKLEPDHAIKAAVQTEKPEKKPKTTRKKTVASKSTASIAIEVNDTGKHPIDNSANHGPDVSGEFFTAAEDLPEETVKTKPKISKSKPAPKRAPKRSVDEAATAVESINTATPERPTKRPRRQAAISAIEKVAMGYEDELIPVDKLRRAPEVESKPRRSKKADVLGSSATALISPPLTAQAGSVFKDVQDCDKSTWPSSPPVVVKRGRKPGIKTGRTCKPDEQLEVVEPLQTKHISPTQEDNHAPEDEPPLAPKPPARRGRKPGVKITKGLTDAADEKQEVLQPQPAEHVSTTKEDSHVSDDEQQLPPKLPAKRGRKPGSKNRKIVATTDHKEPTVEPAATELASNHFSSARRNDYTPDDEPMFSPKPPAKRGRKPGITISKRRACELDEETEASISTSTKCLSSTTDHEHSPEDEPPLPAKLPAKRGRPPGVKNRTVDTATIRMETTAGPTARLTAGPTAGQIVTQLAPREETSTRTKPKYSTDTDSKAQATKMPRHGTTGGMERPLAKQPARGSSRNTVEERPTKQRRALADFDGNIVRKSLTVEGKKILPSAVDSVNPATNQQNKPRKTKKQPVVQSDPRLNTIRAGETQVLPQHEHSPNEGSSHETTTTPKTRHVIATEEDLDWLFEKPQSRRPKPAATRQPAAKTRHMAPDQCAKDMDLDDLLATVDGLAGGELLTGRRGRVVAS